MLNRDGRVATEYLMRFTMLNKTERPFTQSILTFTNSSGKTQPSFFYRKQKKNKKGDGPCCDDGLQHLEIS